MSFCERQMKRKMERTSHLLSSLTWPLIGDDEVHQHDYTVALKVFVAGPF